jgi:predicted glycosyltransferase
LPGSRGARGVRSPPSRTAPSGSSGTHLRVAPRWPRGRESPTRGWPLNWAGPTGRSDWSVTTYDQCGGFRSLRQSDVGRSTPNDAVTVDPSTNVHWSLGSTDGLAEVMSRSPLRYLLYSHDTYGLGHFRRAALIAGGLVAASPEAQVLIVTGSPQTQAFALPERVDSLKLPAATKDVDGSYRPRKITDSIDELVRLRASVLLAACTEFVPDVILVDQSPTGMAGELIPVLEQSTRRANRPRLVLGLREIVDEASRVEEGWHRDGSWEWLERYDDVVVYGDERVLSTARELGLDRRLPGAVTHVGFVAPTMPAPSRESKRDPFLLVTPGGGGDGQTLLRRFLDAAEDGALRIGATQGVRSLIVTGPLMSSDRRAEVARRAARLSDVEVVEFVDNMRELIASSIAVISMAGYNTVVEELAAAAPALLVPRTAPRLEQDIRASRLDPHTNLERCPVDQLTSGRLHDFVSGSLDARACRLHNEPERQLDLNGVDRVGKMLTSSNIDEQELAHV